MDRIILHSDCNNFFASAEAVLNPELKGIPLAVGGDIETRHGIILAKNELAKKYGVKTAEPIWQALKKCPELKIVPPQHKVYEEFSKRINEIYVEYTDLVEKFSIDESWLDVTGSTALFGDGKTIADTIRNRVKAETGISVSIGVSFNKVFAKLGSDYKKPDATTVISRDNFKEIIYPLPVSDMLYVGKRAYEILGKCNIKTIGDLAAADSAFLTQKLGKNAEMLIRYARGEDEEEVKPYYYEQEIKSIGKGMTFPRDITERDDISKGVYILADNIGAQMRKKGLKCTTVQVHIKDENLKTISRQMTLKKPTNMTRDIFCYAMELIERNWKKGRPIRMLTVTGTNFSDGFCGAQMSLFDEAEREDKHEKLELAIDKIRKTYGKASITNAVALKDDTKAKGE